MGFLSGKTDSDRSGNTIFIYTGDHGYEFGETGTFFYSFALNDYSTHIPLIIRTPEKQTVRAIAFQDAFTPYRFEIVDEKNKLEVNLKQSSLVVGSYDNKDSDVKTLADEHERIRYLWSRIQYFDKNAVNSAAK